MSSLLFRHNLSPDSIRQYLRGYRHELPIPPEVWAKAESVGLPIGTIVVCLESVSLSSPASPDGSQDSYKVTELCFVVGCDSDKPIVVSLTAETYELAFLENTMVSRASGARLAGRDFNYLIIEPSIPLAESQISEIENMGMQYAQGGSRRERLADGSGVADPAGKLLSALGLPLPDSGTKKVIDMAAFCHAVFCPGQAEQGGIFDGIGDMFRGVPRADADSASDQPRGESESDSPRGGAGAAAPAGAPAGAQDDMKSLLGLGGIFSASDEPDIPPSASQPGQPAQPPKVKIPASSPAPESKPAAGPATIKPPVAAPPPKPALAPPPKPALAPPLKPAGAPPLKPDPGQLAAGAQPPAPTPAQPLPPGDRSAPQAETAVPAPPGNDTPAAPGMAEAPVERKAESAKPLAAEKQPAKEARPAPKMSLTEAAGASDGMETLVAKLEQQVTRARLKLSERVEQIHAGLEAELRDLIESAALAESRAEDALCQRLNALRDKLTTSADAGQEKASAAVGDGRDQIKQSHDRSLLSLDETQTALNDSLGNACRDLRLGARELADAAIARFRSLVSERQEGLKNLATTICQRLQESAGSDLARLAVRFENQKLRTEAEKETILKSFDLHLSTFGQDLDGACERAREKLQSSKAQFELSMQQSVTMYDLELSRAVKALMGTTLVPALRRRRNELKHTVADLKRGFAEDTAADLQKHLASLDALLAEMRQEFSEASSGWLSAIETTFDEISSRWQALFDETASTVEAAGQSACALYQEADEKIAQTNEAIRQLVDESGEGATPSLVADRDATLSAMEAEKTTAQADLSRKIDEAGQTLEEFAARNLAALTETRESLIASTREARESAIAAVRARLQEAFQTIHATREKHLE